MSALVDTSVWVAYFRGEEESDILEELIDEGLLVINDLVLAEVMPLLLVKKQFEIVNLLKEIPRISLSIDWDGIVQLQVTCLRNGINKVGIPDLIIAQHAIQNGLSLYSLDKHFRLMANHIPLALIE